MLVLVLTSLLSSASAQDEFADVAAPEPDGCWGSASSPFPEQDSVDVPLDISPRFFLQGPCVDAVQVVLEDAAGAVFEVAVNAAQHDWNTTVIVDPVDELAPQTDYILSITTELGTPSELRFTTGDALSTPREELDILDVMADGWCSDREQADYSLVFRVDSDDDGLVGYVSRSPLATTSWIPVLAQGGRAEVWAPTDARLGDRQACASIVRIEDDGTIGEWEEVCAATPDVGDCRQRRRLLGCAREPQLDMPAPMSALLFLPALGLLGLRRRRQD